jgi:hypothetical protein
MKTINKTLISALAGIALFSFATPVQAQLKSGDALAPAAGQSRDIFLDVRQIVLLKKGEPKKSQIVINDPGKIKQLVAALHLVKSDRLACDMAWQVTFIKKTGSVETFVCKHCVEIRDKNGTERFQTPPEFYKLVQHIEE